ncbi:MAG: hypothetical protein AAB295_06415, partial [Chloroflexota bacterium]
FRAEASWQHRNFFNPEGADKRAYLVHVQDEIGQMKGHGHAWVLERVTPDGRGFTARGKHGEKPLPEEASDFELDPACRDLRRPRTPLEAAESVDMMRVLEHGFPIALVETGGPAYSVDTPGDLEAVVARMRTDPMAAGYLARDWRGAGARGATP